MKIKLLQAGKRFNREWIFRHTDLELEKGTSYAITGPNGSGKSTLLQCIGGMMQLSEGHIHFYNESLKIADEQMHVHVSFCAPYLDVIEEMTLLELLRFHKQFKPFLKGINEQEAIAIVNLQKAAHKQIRYYSSGMKQRVKLAQAILFDAAVVLLDEPCSNLDAGGIDLYHSLIQTYCRERLVIVCSNDKAEYHFCQQQFSMLDYKPAN